MCKSATLARASRVYVQPVKKADLNLGQIRHLGLGFLLIVFLLLIALSLDEKQAARDQKEQKEEPQEWLLLRLIGLFLFLVFCVLHLRRLEVGGEEEPESEPENRK